MLLFITAADFATLFSCYNVCMRSPDEAIKVMEHKFPGHRTTGMCLWSVQEAYAAQHLYADANEAQKHVHLNYDEHPPRGAIVWWHSATHGHVGISVGDGKFIGVDLVDGHYRPGEIGVSHITAPRLAWGQTYRGWSADINGVPIPELQHHAPHGGGHHHGGRHHDPSSKQPVEVHLTKKQIQDIAEAVLTSPISDPLDESKEKISLRRLLVRMAHRQK